MPAAWERPPDAAQRAERAYRCLLAGATPSERQILGLPLPNIKDASDAGGGGADGCPRGQFWRKMTQ
jgi:hypothetical protein